MKFEWFRLIHVKERKMKNWTKILVKKQKDQWKSPVTGKGLFLNVAIEGQQNYYEQWGKESISELSIKIT